MVGAVPQVRHPTFRTPRASAPSPPRDQAVGGVNSARVQDSSFDGGAVVNCLGVVHMEEEVQDRVQVEVGREEQWVGETHGKEQGEEKREQTINQPLIMDDHECGVTRTNTFLSHCDVTHNQHVHCAEEK